MICDICSGSGEGGQHISSDNMRKAVDAGYNPFKGGGAGLTPGKMAAFMGVSPDMAFANWKSKVVSDTSGWYICPACREGLSRYIDGPIPTRRCPRCKHDNAALVRLDVCDKCGYFDYGRVVAPYMYVFLTISLLSAAVVESYNGQHHPFFYIFGGILLVLSIYLIKWEMRNIPQRRLIRLQVKAQRESATRS